MNRYKDAYLMARASAGVGNAIKYVGRLAIGVAVLAFFLITFKSGSIGLAEFIVALPVVAVPIVVGILFYCIGVLIAAQGQQLKATLDTAVNSSPFLSDDQRARTMSL